MLSSIEHQYLDLQKFHASARDAAEFLKAFGHEGRLLILCHLIGGEKSVGELENLLGSRQPAISQQLARLRDERIVACRREGKMIYYSLVDAKSRQVLALVHQLFSASKSDDQA